MNSKGSILEDLTPFNSEYKNDVYSKLLHEGIRQKNVKNIALTGPYGSGKSSILRAFENEHKEYKFLNISLATFYEDQSKTLTEPEKKEQYKLIEISILQQILYTVNAEDIPNSRFKRISNLDFYSFLWLITTIILAVIGITLIKAPAFITKTSWWTYYSTKESNSFAVLIATLIFPLIIQLAYYVVQFLGNSSLNKINISGSGGLEMASHTEASILNKHLDEILYFFEKTTTNVVVIEDLDRFKNTEIFTKLRELNQLINGAKNIGSKVTFIYALGDDVFKEGNRSKFFDFIIPVIPFITSANSFDKILEKSKNASIVISEMFLKKVSLYIDDMRILKNIFNEFYVYNEQLKLIGVNQEKLFALIIYKNKYPDDFAKLEFNRGLLYEAFSVTKGSIINDLISVAESELLKLEKSIDDSSKELLNSINELKSVYLYAIVERLEYFHSFKIDNDIVELAAAKDDANFLSLMSQRKIQYHHKEYSSTYSKTADFSFASVENELNSKYSYNDRAKIITQKNTYELENNKKRSEQLIDEIEKCKSYSLSRLMQDDKLNMSLFNNELCEKELIILLLKYGYIDESYPSFISNFYEGRLTSNDKIYLMSLSNDKLLDPDFGLQKIQEIVTHISFDDYKNSKILNFDLLDFLFDDFHNDDSKRALNQIALQLSNKTAASLQFIDRYLLRNKNTARFINMIIDNWPDWLYYCNNEASYSHEKNINYAKLILINGDDVSITKLNNVNSSVYNLFRNNDDLLNHFISTEQSRIKEIFVIASVKFKFLEKIPPAYVDFIYNNSMYDINAENINFIIINYSNQPISTSEINEQNYGSILSSECESLIKYVHKNIDFYVGNVFLILNDNIKETEENVISLLENENILIDLKDALIEKELCQISNIKSITNQELWGKLFSEIKVKAIWSNILEYFKIAEKIDWALVIYLNNNEVFTQLSIQNLGQYFEENPDVIFQLANALLQNNISDIAFANIAKAFPKNIFKINESPLDDVSIHKVDSLIELDFIDFTVANYNYIKQHYDNLYIKLIEKNIDAFIEKQSEYNLTSEGSIALISSKNIDINKVISIIKNINIDDLSSSIKLVDAICKILLENLIIIVNMDLINALMRLTTILNNKLSLLIIYATQFNDEFVDNGLKLLGEPYSLLTQTNKKPKFALSKINIELAKKLDDINYISSYKIDDDAIKFILKNKK